MAQKELTNMWKYPLLWKATSSKLFINWRIQPTFFDKGKFAIDRVKQNHELAFSGAVS